VGREKFHAFCELLDGSGWEIINAGEQEAFDMLADGLAFRAAIRGRSIPNVEVKFAKAELDFYTLDNRLEFVLNGKPLFISPLELQIAYKLYLGSSKDVQDAYHIYRLLAAYLDKGKLKAFIKQLDVESLARKWMADMYG